MTWRVLFNVRRRLPSIEAEKRQRLRARLRRGDLGYGRPQADVLELLIGVDRTGTGLVWPKLAWLSATLERPDAAVQKSLQLLKERRVLDVLEIPVHAVRLNYDALNAT